MSEPLMQSEIPGLPVRRGKVRDVYELDEQRLLIVASDRISAFDVIMPTPIPDKGKILTQLSNFWFAAVNSGRLAGPGDLKIQTHLLETDINRFPAALAPFRQQLAGRAVIVKKTRVIPIECVVRGYITGSGWKDYQKTAGGGAISGIQLPPGLRQCEQLPAPIFTPSTKAAQGHDEPISFQRTAAEIGERLAEKIREISLSLYSRAADFARGRGILIADTKFEFGLLPGSEEPVLIDEILTPDSSRFWPAAEYQPGRDQASFDKQYVRNYLETLAWNKTPPGPALPAEVAAGTRAKYVEAYERLTEKKFAADSQA